MNKKLVVLMSILLVLVMVFTGCSSPADKTDDETGDET